MNAERIAKAVWNAYVNIDWDELGPRQQREMIAAAQAELDAIGDQCPDVSTCKSCGRSMHNEWNVCNACADGEA